jgi:hypothetical protein
VVRDIAASCILYHLYSIDAESVAFRYIHAYFFIFSVIIDSVRLVVPKEETPIQTFPSRGDSDFTRTNMPIEMIRLFISTAK